MENAVPVRGFGAAVGFALTALVSLAFGGAMAVQPALFAGALTPYAQAWIYLMIFGFGFSAVFAVIYAALPLIFGVPLQSRQAAFMHYGLHLAGLSVLLLVPFVPDLPQARMMTLLIFCGVLVFVWNVGASLRRMVRPDAASAFIVTACLWLLVAAVMGPPAPGEPVLQALVGTRWMSGWLVFVVAGVFFNTLFALALRLLQDDPQSRRKREATGWYAFAVINLGVAWSFAGVAVGPVSLLVATVCIFAAGTLVLVWDVLDLQRRSGLVPGSYAKVLSSVLCAVPFAAALLIIWAGQTAWNAPVAAEAQLAADASQAAPIPPTVKALEWATGLFAFFVVAVPGLIAGVFLLLATRRKQDSRVRTAPAFAAYSAGAVMLVLGAGLSQKELFACGGVVLCLAALGFLRDLVTAVCAARED